MSKTYKKTDLLRNEILAVSGKFFKQYGYEKTTFQMIADELNICKASISYHFKSKPWLLFYLFGKGIELIYNSILENMDENTNKFKFHCAAHFYFYREIMSGERIWNLFYNEDHRQLWIDEQIFIIENYFREIMLDFKKEFDEEELHSIAVMSLGAKMSMFKEFAKHPEWISVDKHCYYTAYLTGTLSKLDEATITKNIQDAVDFVNAHPITADIFWDF